MINRTILTGKVKDKTILNRRSTSEKIVYPIISVLFALYAVTLLYPFVWMFVNSLKGMVEYAVGDTFALPEKWLFSNYVRAFEQLTLENGTTFLQMLFNSVWYTVLSTSISIFASSVTGYCLAKYDFKAKKYIYAIAIFAMTIPIVGSNAAHLKLTKNLGIYDTPLYVVFSSMSAWGFNFLVMYGAFRSVSWTYAEATFIDGGGHYSVFFRIMLPQMVGPMTTLFIMASITNWNDYMTMLMYMPSYPTIASGLYSFQATAVRNINYPVYFAGLLVSMVPIIVLFSLTSNIIMTNLSMGGLKG